MSSQQYLQASRSNEEWLNYSSLPITIKRIKTAESSIEPLVSPEEPPIVVVEQNVGLRRRLAKLREDYQAIERIRNHIEEEMNNIEKQLKIRERQQR